MPQGASHPKIQERFRGALVSFYMAIIELCSSAFGAVNCTPCQPAYSLLDLTNDAVTKHFQKPLQTWVIGDPNELKMPCSSSEKKQGLGAVVRAPCKNMKISPKLLATQRPFFCRPAFPPHIAISPIGRAVPACVGGWIWENMGKCGGK